MLASCLPNECLPASVNALCLAWGASAGRSTIAAAKSDACRFGLHLRRPFGGQARRHGKSRAGANQQARLEQRTLDRRGPCRQPPLAGGLSASRPVLVSRPLPLELWGLKFSRQVNSILPQRRQVQTDGTLLGSYTLAVRAWAWAWTYDQPVICE
jgi:hypothetical protein